MDMVIVELLTKNVGKGSKTFKTPVATAPAGDAERIAHEMTENAHSNNVRYEVDSDLPRWESFDQYQHEIEQQREQEAAELKRKALSKLSPAERKAIGLADEVTVEAEESEEAEEVEQPEVAAAE